MRQGIKLQISLGHEVVTFIVYSMVFGGFLARNARGLGTNGTEPVYRVQSDFDYESILLGLYQE